MTRYRALTTPAEAMAAEGQYVERRCKDIGAWEYVTPGRSLLFYEGMFRLGWQFRARVVEPEDDDDMEHDFANIRRGAVLQQPTPPQPSPVQGDGVLPPLPDPFARVCNDGFWLQRERGTARFNVVDSRYPGAAQEVYSAEQMREYVRAALAAAQPGGGFVVPCKGADCGSTNYRFHSAACFAEHEATVAAAAAADQGSAK